MENTNLARLIPATTAGEAEASADRALDLGVAFYGRGRDTRVLTRRVRRIAPHLFRLDARVEFT